MEATLLIVNKWANPASFSFIFGLLKQTVQFLQQIYQKNTHQMPGFEPTTSRTWVVSYNHETNESTDAQRRMLLHKYFVQYLDGSAFQRVYLGIGKYISYLESEYI